MGWPMLLPEGVIFREWTWDRDLWHHVYCHNEYKLPERLNPGDVVVDVGGHTGAFAHLVWTLGSRKVWSYEASPDNFALLRRNLGGLDGVEVVHAGVWGEPLPERMTYTPSVEPRNTGGGTVLDKGGIQIPMISFEEVVERAGKVHLLKLDCEGAEWSIIQSRAMANVDYVVGEYHQDPNRLGWMVSNLVGTLLRQGFHVTTRPDTLYLGHFWARRNGLKFQA